MPRYFFNVFYGRTTTDHVGEEFPDQDATWKEATVLAGQILQGLHGDLVPGREWRVEVTDEFGNRLFILRIHAEVP
ncbi:DUF6894 family protein [Bradyrhizobium arachidis]|uniref:DUF6894 domain-containing protein n=1 Tax=Bradyrhizobium arachidis TaxID=858423 RepID=A0AAE7TMT4_9BRAD|nr:hypothetical protein [Bradyrhizobium arachidis]QOZ73824.1 hypothetical protein WN72_39535 [Bradyrhizobium arachidis]SFV19161.1 hypothetical protein SAMN05192541_14637 [Bradyrhizobium arachidis]